MTSKSVSRYLKFKKLIRLARRCSKRGRTLLVKRSPNWFIRALIRMGSMYTKGRLSAQKMRKLNRYRREMEALAKSRNMETARKRLVQRGGFLPFLLPIAAVIGKALLGAAAGAAGTAIIRKVIKKS